MIYASYKNQWGVEKFKVSRINHGTFTLTSEDKKFPYKSVRVKQHLCELSFEHFNGSERKAVEKLEAMPFDIRMQAAPYYLKEVALLDFLRNEAEGLAKQFIYDQGTIEATIESALDSVSEETMEETGYYSVDDIVRSIDPIP